MDPDANIAAQRLLIARLRADPGDQDARTDLAELTRALRDWLRGGGFLPAAPDWLQIFDTSYTLLHPGQVKGVT
jgi:hypothetical protein